MMPECSYYIAVLIKQLKKIGNFSGTREKNQQVAIKL